MMSSNNESHIEGVCQHCTYAPMLQEAMGETLLELVKVEETAKAIGAIPYMDAPTKVTPQLEGYLTENPCKFIENGVCAVAKFAINELAGR